MAREPIVNQANQAPVPTQSAAAPIMAGSGSSGGVTDRDRDAALRPKFLREVIGQKAVVQRLQIALNACR